jgi:membrane associated rhomboid family serine protease
MKKYPATFQILGLCVALQLVFTVYPELTGCLGFNPGNLWTWPGILTYQVTHAGWAHLTNNFAFGLPFMFYLEHKLGSKKFTEFYFGCGVISALFHAALGGPGILIGASGSLFGVMTGACLAFGRSKATHTLAMFYCTFMLLEQLLNTQNPFLFGIAFWGHVGGAVGAFVLSSWFYNTRAPRASKR